VIRYLANSIDVIEQMGHQYGKRGITEIYFPGLDRNCPLGYATCPEEPTGCFA